MANSCSRPFVQKCFIPSISRYQVRLRSDRPGEIGCKSVQRLTREFRTLHRDPTGRRPRNVTAQCMQYKKSSTNSIITVWNKPMSRLQVRPYYLSSNDYTTSGLLRGRMHNTVSISSWHLSPCRAHFSTATHRLQSQVSSGDGNVGKLSVESGTPVTKLIEGHQTRDTSTFRKSYKYGKGKASDEVSCKPKLRFKLPAHQRSKTPRTPWGFIADVHFQDKGLDRINLGLDYLIAEFRKRGVRHIFCLGDMLNTRQQVSVPALSSCMMFFNRLMDEFDSVHVVLGNHDMHLKHSRTVTSLDALLMNKLQPNVRLYKEIELTEVDGIQVLMLPFHEDQNEILRYLKKMPKEVQNDTVAMAHLSINGATTNKHMHIKHHGQVGHKSFQDLRHTFTGHFHSFQTLGNLTYIGSPLQFTFSDLNDPNRGGVLYYPDSNSFTQVINPHAEVFKETTFEKVMASTGEEGLQKLKAEFAYKYVQVTSGDGLEKVDNRAFPKVRDRLIAAGALDVKLWKKKPKAGESGSLSAVLDNGAAAFIERTKSNNNRSYMLETIRSYLDKMILGDGKSSLPNFPRGTSASIVDRHKELAKEGQNIIDTVAGHNDIVDGQVFNANIKCLRMENFLGVQGGIYIPFQDIEEKVWLLEGENGCGKSTVVEAVTWCQFGKFVRSDMAAGDAVNDILDHGCRVVVEYSNGYSIERYRKHKTLGSNGARVYLHGQYLPQFEKGGMQATQQAIDDLLGVDYNRFLKTSIYVGNQAASFVSSSSLQRRDILEEVLGLGLFDKYLDVVRGRKKDARVELLNTSAMIVGLKEQETAATARTAKIQTERENSEALANDLSGKKITVENSVRSLTAKAASLAGTKERFTEIISRRKERRRLQLIVKSQREHYNALKEHIDDVASYRYQVQGQNHAFVKLAQSPAKQRVASKKQTGGASSKASCTGSNCSCGTQHTSLDVCPVCDRPLPEGVTHSHDDPVHQKVVAVRGMLAKGMNDASSAVDNQLGVQHDKRTRELHERAQMAKGALLEAEKTLVQFEATHASKIESDELSAFNVQRRSSRAAKSGGNVGTGSEGERKDEVADAGELATTTLENQINFVDQRLTESTTKLHKIDKIIYEAAGKCTLLANLEKDEMARNKVLATRLGGLREQEAILKHTASIDKFWEDGFSKKSGSMRNYLLDQSIHELNRILESVLDLVRGPHDISISFNSDLKLSKEYSKRSSGQRKRTDLAIFMALSQISRNHSRFQPGFMVLDELYDSLDSEGREAVTDLVKGFSARVRNVIVASPELHAGLEFPYVVSVSMTAQGSRLIDSRGLIECYSDDRREELNDNIGPVAGAV